ncbi:hypothetical protein [Ovoidimarina sediminis]|uniref:hypothetical protein n=1 Tax=Ovoidimarina sediminis TaxID=3079856 RepID=UPI002931E5CC|nr:hypothetical protein [Rhodophyticola sp. MJ-SS7]
MIDVDDINYPVELLREWKEFAEAAATIELRGFSVARKRSFDELEEKIPELIQEMRTDHRKEPFVREFVLLERGWAYNGAPNNPIFYYYFEDHDGLISKLKVMENYGAVKETTYNNVERFEFTEEFADYLDGNNP